MNKILTENGLKKCAKLGRVLTCMTIKIPTEFEILNSLGYLKTNLSGQGRINYSYAKNATIGYNLALSLHNTKTYNLLLDDINANKKIYLNSYR